MKSSLIETNKDAKLGLIKSKKLLNLTNNLLSKKGLNQLEKQFKSRPCLIEEGHSKPVTELVVTPNGKTIISGSDDNTIKLWDIETGECLKTLKGHSGRIHSLAITLDGKQIISGSLMETKIWDLQSGKCLKNIIQKQYATIFTNDDYITSFQVISSDGNTIASVNYYEEVRVWNQEDFSFISKFYTNVGTSPRLAISPDGNIIAVGKGSTSDRCGKIEIWDIKKNQCIHKLNKHTNLVSVLVITPDNKLVSGSWDKTIRVWDIESGKCLKVLEGQKSFVYALAVTPDGNTLVSSSSNPNIIKIWDLSTGKCVNTIETSAEKALAITPDGKNIVTGYGIWSLKTGECIKKLKSYDTHLKFIAKVNDENATITIKDEYIKYGELKLFDEDGNYLKTLKKQKDFINTLSISSVIQEIAREHDDFCDFIGFHVAKLWDEKNDKCILTVDTNNNIEIDSQGYFNASDEIIDKYLRIKDSSLSQRKLNKQEINHFRRKNDYFRIEDLCIEKKENLHINNSDSSQWGSYTIEPILITPDRRTLVTAHHDNTLKIWDIQTGKCLKSLEGHTGFPKTIAITPDGQTIITSIIRDAYDGDEMHEIYTADDGEEYINTYVEYDDEYEESFEILLWSLKNGNYLGGLYSHISSVNTLDISPNGKTLVSGSAHDKAYENDTNINYGAMDYEIILWDIQNKKEIRTFCTQDSHNDSINILKYTPDGKIIVSGSDDYTIKLWNVETGECLKTLKGHCGCINTLTVSSDGKIIVSGSDDYTIKLWNIETGECVKTLMGHTNEVKSLQLTSNDKNIIVISNSNMIKILDIESGKSLRTIEDYTSSNSSLSISSDGNTIVFNNENTFEIRDFNSGLMIQTISHNIDYESIGKSLRIVEQEIDADEDEIPEIDIDDDKIPF